MGSTGNKNLDETTPKDKKLIYIRHQKTNTTYSGDALSFFAIVSRTEIKVREVKIGQIVCHSADCKIRLSPHQVCH